MNRSGLGVLNAIAKPAIANTSPNQRKALRHSVIQMIAMVIVSKAPTPNAGVMRMAPGNCATHCATHTIR